MNLLKVKYKSLKGETLIVYSEEQIEINVLLNTHQQQELSLLQAFFSTNSLFNLLNITKEDENIKAEFIVFEPDYLIDISSLAECFRPFGNHPLNYTLSRLQIKENTPYILLGNTANYIIDELINEDTTSPVDYTNIMKKMFKSFPFEFSTCEELKTHSGEKNFFDNTKKHYENLRYVVNYMFPKAHINKENLLLEPSFICNILGLQGRLDIMQNDYSSFIELKSGKAIEDFRSGGTFVGAAINHYTQMILYLAVLEFNLDINPETIRSYLLYSKYPVLSKEKHSRKQLSEALTLRNQIVAFDYIIQEQNNVEHTRTFLENLTPEALNTKGLSGNFFDNYLKPSIDKFRLSFQTLRKIDQLYFLRLYSFVVKELWISKAGEREYEGVRKASILWNVSLEDKITAGEILYDLKIVDNRAASNEQAISLNIPVYEDLYLPNFRQGDMIILYERNNKDDLISKKQVFKGSILNIDNSSITIRLRSLQKSVYTWNKDSFYAIEHDHVDSGHNSMFRSLSAFVSANQRRKDLLLGIRKPEISKPETPFSYLKNDIERFVEKAMAAKDCLLLVGPPGTGKTSLALKRLVERVLENEKSNILLLSYTNRAVDEICHTLNNIEGQPSYIRIGSELNCASEYRQHLLDIYLEKGNNRKEVIQLLDECSVFVGTLASIWNRPELFSLKQFDIAIIDEASQLLEPHLLGILCKKTKNDENAIRKFVLIGDHKQLPAVVLQSKEESRVYEKELNDLGIYDLSESLFERLYKLYSKQDYSDSFDTLTIQGRMHPEIAEFPSSHFYNKQLTSAELPHQTETDIKYKRLTFHNIMPEEKDSPLKSNREEAIKVASICKEIYDENPNTFQASSIGIITPFRNQIALIRKELLNTGISSFSDIIVDTVERFQGSQRDIIIYSFCIKTDYQLLALPNILIENENIIDRKLNVVLTRAKKRLYIVGNENLLTKNQVYKKLIEYIRASHI